jgi:quinol monooxygenase YgiN
MAMLRILASAAALALAATVARADDAIHRIVNVDLMPSDQTVGTQILTGYAHRARSDPDVLSVTLVQQFGLSNHFILVEAFASKAAYERYLEADYVRSFRSALYPHLGSPWDERLGNDIAR